MAVGLHGHGARGLPSVNPALVPHGASVNTTTRPIRVYDASTRRPLPRRGAIKQSGGNKSSSL